DRAVDGERGDQPEPVAPDEGVPAGIDQRVVEQRGGRDQREAEQAEPGHDQRVDLDEPRALAAFRFGRSGLEVERAAEIHVGGCNYRTGAPAADSLRPGYLRSRSARASHSRRAPLASRAACWRETMARRSRDAVFAAAVRGDRVMERATGIEPV